ncbi:MAG: hypothetical protein JSU09_07295 [Bacteroidetes bacterium]|nr:hypothetical protein [Bacteroidota bacterium]
MKTTITFILVALIAVASYAQPGKRRGAGQAREGRISGQTIDASQVPDAVKNTFAATGATALRWEKHEAKGKAAKSWVKYVAVYDQDGKRCRARFREDGSAMSSSKYMKADQLPANIKSASEAKAQGQRVMGGEEIKTKKGETFYRVMSRGGGSRTVSVFDANGQPVTKEKMPEDLKDSEGEEEGDGN